MPFEVFQKGIDNLRKIGYSKRVGFHITSEPLLSPDLISFIGYARNQLPNCWLQLLTNGRKLNLQNAEELLNAGINEITVNWYTTDRLKPIPEKFEKIKTEVLAKKFPLDNILSGHGPGAIEGDKIFRYNVTKRELSEVLSNQGGSSPNKEKIIRNQFLGFCHSPVTDFHITTDGSVSKCSKDVRFEDPMGNIMNADIMDVWNSSRFIEVRKMLLNNDRSGNEMCRRFNFQVQQLVKSWY